MVGILEALALRVARHNHLTRSPLRYPPAARLVEPRSNNRNVVLLIYDNQNSQSVHDTVCIGRTHSLEAMTRSFLHMSVLLLLLGVHV